MGPAVPLLTRLARTALVLAAPACLAACPAVRNSSLSPPSQVPAMQNTSQPLKVHLVSGELLVLRNWQELPRDSGLRGTGTRWDVARRTPSQFDGSLPRDSIALLETTVERGTYSPGAALLATYTVVSGLVTLVCLTDPKSCFGSCPTFYLDDPDRPVAEGFSGSVARALEATDIDYLGRVRRSGASLALVMRNEALETHAVRSVRLLVAPVRPGARLVRAGDGRYFYAHDEAEPDSCAAAEGDCAAWVAWRDGREWFAPADSTDLGALDSLDLRFDSVPQDAGLLLTSRQSLVSTYVFYQTLAYAGRRAGDLLAEVERRGTAALPGAWAMMSRLGAIQVLAGRAEGPLEPAGVLGEPGPIASDAHALPLRVPAGPGPLRVRLRFARGAWRFDHAALARLEPTGGPRPVPPVAISRPGREESDGAALARLLDPDRYLVTWPGDRYRLTFDLPPEAADLEVFLESRGYYYEWMRPEWLREENPAMLELLARSPEEMLRRLAPGYSRLAPRLERLFWSSRFGGR